MNESSRSRRSAAESQQSKAGPRPVSEADIAAARDPRPQVSDHSELHIKVSKILKALGAKKSEYRKGSGVYDLGESMSVFDGQEFHAVDADALRTIVSERVRLYRIKKVNEVPTKVTVEPQLGLVKSVRSERRGVRKKAIPRIDYIMHVPFFTPDGDCVVRPGYHKKSRTFLLLSKEMRAAFKDFDASSVTEQQARNAVAHLWSIFHQFPFKSDADWANLMALMLEQVLRPSINGPTPIYAVSAPTTGTGKSLLTDTATAIVGGHDGRVTKGDPGSNDEWRKTILSGLREQKPFFVFDNVINTVNSPAVSYWATSYPLYRDRQLQKSDDGAYINTCTKIINGNALRMNSDNTRRSVPIEIDAGVEAPAERDVEYVITNLGEYVITHQAALLRDLLTIVAWWVKQDQPLGDAHLGSFEAWARVVSGVLDSVGVVGFLDNLKVWRGEADDDREALDQFIDLWVSLVNSPAKDAANPARVSMTASEIWEMVKPHGIFMLDEKKSPAHSMGRLLKSQLSNRVVNGYVITKVGQRDWRLCKKDDPSWPQD